MVSFNDPPTMAQYTDGPPRLVPGFADLHRMTAILLGERAPENARVLVLGTGGGLELKALAEHHPGWRFDGVDPAPEMLDLAKTVLGPLAARVRFHEDIIDVAPEGPFDAAVCLLTMHFVPLDGRRRTLTEVKRRLGPGAPLVVAHLSFPQDADGSALWLSRYVSFAVASGVDRVKAEIARGAIAARSSVLAPEQDEEVLHDAGFSNVSLFYAGLAFRDWVAHA